MKVAVAVMASFAFLALSGCITESAEETDYKVVHVEETYRDGHFFTLSGCEGVEISRKWVGFLYPSEFRPPPPPWEDIRNRHQFAWSLEVAECQRIGWGPLERGPVIVGLEVHDAYTAPDACRVDLDETFFLRYVHQLYVDDAGVADYAAEWALPSTTTRFSQDTGMLNAMTLHMKPAESELSKIKLHKTGVLEFSSSPINVAFFWFQDNQVHRLTLHRESRTSLGDAAVIEMAPPSIMADLPGPQPANASRLTDLQWTGELVTFSDPTCSERVP